MELIEREALLTALNSDDTLKHARHLIRLYIQEAPTIDPIRAAGGCYCRECRWGQQDDLGVMHCHKYHIHKKPGGYCDDGEPSEAQDDG